MGEGRKIVMENISGNQFGKEGIGNDDRIY